jgi:Membrane bound O-acyl transferase family
MTRCIAPAPASEPAPASDSSRGRARQVATPPAARKKTVCLGLAPLIVLPALAIALCATLPPWVFMWLLAVAIFAGCKWLTWWDAAPARRDASLTRNLIYLTAYPGLDASHFLRDGAPPRTPDATQWLTAVARTFLGAALFWGVARFAPAGQPVFRGWVGMVGVIFMLHFGLFDVLTYTWRKFGVEADVLMDRPLGAPTLADFWGNRWNRAFKRLVHDHLFRPLSRRVGPAWATFITFIASGLVHDLVISLPAGAGFGLPTAYFALQGAGVLVQRGPLGKRLHIDHGPTGRVFTLAVLICPMFWLFHPAFVQRVFVPFMHACGAL